jgi:hypothetical protein
MRCGRDPAPEILCSCFDIRQCMKYRYLLNLTIIFVGKIKRELFLTHACAADSYLP